MRAANRHLLSLSLAAFLLVACGQAAEFDQPLASEDLGTGEEALSSGNGLGTNGLNRNGLNRNGLNRNGLNRNGLATAEFSAWFNEDAASSDAVMRYTHACAAPLGSIVTWRNPITGRSHLWVGVFGLAPAWTAGAPATVAEQQAVTACLAAHVNAWGLQVTFSLAGRSTNGSLVPVTPWELGLFKHREAAFFGNLFDGGPVYACNHKGGQFSSDQSLTRACGIDPRDVAGQVSVNCAPMVFVGKCDDRCTYVPNTEQVDTCTWSGTTYRAITTRISDAEINRCGDGICQASEHCGSGTDPRNCQDCGLCP